jgi:hypothetical protein
VVECVSNIRIASLERKQEQANIVLKHDYYVDCRLGLDVFGEPLDDEDYLHEVTTLADPKYRENNDRRWKVLFGKLVSEEGYVWWDVWNSLILYNLEKVHPFRRMIVSNVFSDSNHLHTRYTHVHTFRCVEITFLQSVPYGQRLNLSRLNEIILKCSKPLKSSLYISKCKLALTVPLLV